MKPFSKWTIEEIEETFQIVLHKKNKVLMDWINTELDISKNEKAELSELSELLQDHVWDWNEEELKIKFIGPLLKMVQFDTKHYQSFFERSIAVEIDNQEFSGTVDFIVANGRRSPKRPFFFINEYKKELESSNDPLGQLLAAMIAAQALNKNQYPVYGAYVMGRFWSFVVLNDKEYSISKAFNAEAEEIFLIFSILKNIKKIIDSLINPKGND